MLAPLNYLFTSFTKIHKFENRIQFEYLHITIHWRYKQLNIQDHILHCPFRLFKPIFFYTIQQVLKGEGQKTKPKGKHKIHILSNFQPFRHPG